MRYTLARISLGILLVMAATAWPDWESLGTLFPTPADFTVSYTARAQERGQHQMEATVESSPFGTLPDGTKIEMFTLTNAHGAIAKVITYGATLTELWMPDRAGKMGDVVLGFDNLQGYLGKHPWFGATVGRVANR
ncbi:MAG: hypothetical protein WBL82_16915, partial [Terriglobales bacterium]